MTTFYYDVLMKVINKTQRFFFCIKALLRISIFLLIALENKACQARRMLYLLLAEHTSELNTNLYLSGRKFQESCMSESVYKITD